MLRVFVFLFCSTHIKHVSRSECVFVCFCMQLSLWLAMVLLWAGIKAESVNFFVLSCLNAVASLTRESCVYVPVSPQHMSCLSSPLSFRLFSEEKTSDKIPLRYLSIRTHTHTPFVHAI